MAMKKSYYSIQGEIIGEAASGIRTGYLPDALGSVTATVDEAGAIQNTYRYKPYGSQLSKSGAGVDPRFLWTGQLGYRQTDSGKADVYVRARHYGSEEGAWTTIDAKWPSESAYGLAGVNPVVFTDLTGEGRCSGLECGVTCCGWLKCLRYFCSPGEHLTCMQNIPVGCVWLSCWKLPGTCCHSCLYGCGEGVPPPDPLPDIDGDENQCECLYDDCTQNPRLDKDQAWKKANAEFWATPCISAKDRSKVKEKPADCDDGTHYNVTWDCKQDNGKWVKMSLSVICCPCCDEDGNEQTECGTSVHVAGF